MRTESPSGECMAVIGSVTQAMHAQRVLANALVYCRVEKADSAATHRGCAYGVVYDCRMEATAMSALRAAHIRVRAVRGGKA